MLSPSAGDLRLAEAFLLGRPLPVAAARRVAGALCELGEAGTQYVRLAKAAGHGSRVWDTTRRLIAGRLRSHACGEPRLRRT